MFHVNPSVQTKCDTLGLEQCSLLLVTTARR